MSKQKNDRWDNERDGIWLGLLFIPAKEYKKKLKIAKKKGVCWICGKKLKSSKSKCQHLFA